MSFILLGILNSQAAGAVGAGDYDLLETTVLGSDTASVEFTGLGAYTDYKHLQVRYVARSTDTGTGAGNDFLMQFNDEAGTNYAFHRLDGNGSAVDSFAAASQTSMRLGFVIRDGRTADSYSAGVIDILDPFSASKNTTVRNLNGNLAVGAQRIELASGLFYQTNAVNTIKLFQDSFSFKTGSRFSLYGIRAA